MIKQHGLSLIEVMVGLLLVGIAVTGLVSQTTLLSQQSSQLTQADEKARFAGRILEEVKGEFSVDPTGDACVYTFCLQVSPLTPYLGPGATGLLPGVSLALGDLVSSDLTFAMHTVTSYVPRPLPYVPSVYISPLLVLELTPAAPTGSPYPGFNVMTARGWLPNTVTVNVRNPEVPGGLSGVTMSEWVWLFDAEPGSLQAQLDARFGDDVTAVLTIEATNPVNTALRKVTVAIDDIVLTQTLTVPGL